MSIPVPERNPAFHSVGFSAPLSEGGSGAGISGGSTVDNIFSAVSGAVRGIGEIFTTGLHTAGDIAGEYNRYEDITTRRNSGINTETLLLIGGGILLVAVVLR